MNNILRIVEDEQTSEFYPTPKTLIDKMLNGVTWDYVETILEPSAGKGDILREIAKAEKIYGWHKRRFDVDCIEIDGNLRRVLKYNFSEERENTLDRDDKERDTFFRDGIHIVHDDFLTYNPFKKYDLIIMNPPFSNGDKHLLKALEMQKNGGNIICLLNAETIRNPYTTSRKELLKQLNKYGADIEYIDNAFISAERKTGVEVALIKVSIPQVQEESDIYNQMKKAEMVDDFDIESTELDVTDFIKSMIAHYNVEVKSGLELIRQYKALVPYIQGSFDTENRYEKNTLRLVNKDSNDNLYVNTFLKDVRLKYWKALLSNPKFVGKLTSKLQREYRERVNRLKDYDFTEFNIYTLATEMNAQVKTGIEEEIIAMFDNLTAEHTWYPEMEKNRVYYEGYEPNTHYRDGWVTNKAHKIGKKVIIPCNAYSWISKEPRLYEVQGQLEDIERILNFLDGGMTRELNTWNFIDHAFKQGITKNIQCKYFKATFYKKGTVHLTFECPELIERFNIYAAQYKQWLPPNYGKTTYSNMTPKEKAVIDSFQGEKAYNEIMAKANYYLAPVTKNQMLMLGE